MMPFFCKNASLQFILEQYTYYTGKTVVIDEGVTSLFTVTVEDWESQEAPVVLIEQALLDKGIVLVPVDETTMKASWKP